MDSGGGRAGGGAVLPPHSFTPLDSPAPPRSRPTPTSVRPQPVTEQSLMESVAGELPHNFALNTVLVFHPVLNSALMCGQMLVLCGARAGW